MTPDSSFLNLQVTNLSNDASLSNPTTAADFNQRSSLNYNYLYNNYINTTNSFNTLNDDCYIIDRKDIMSNNFNKSVFTSTRKSYNSNDWIYPRKLKQSLTDDLFLVPFIIGLFTFIVIIARYSKYLGKYFESLIYAFAVEKFVVDLNVPTKRLLLLLDFVALISLSFISFNFIKALGIVNIYDRGGIIVFLSILGALLLYRIYYYILHKSIEFLIHDKKFSLNLYFDTLIAIRGGGFLLFPLSLLGFYIATPFSSYLLYGAIVLFIIIFIYRFIRLLLLFIKNSISLLYFILYLCALEIVPIFIIYLEVQRM